MKLKCYNKKCGYVWNYGGQGKFYGTCPQCHTPLRLTKAQIIEQPSTIKEEEKIKVLEEDD